MSTDTLQDDEIHHSAGKDIFVPCPRVTDTPTHFTPNLPPFPTSPPPRLPAHEQHHKVLGRLKDMLRHFHLFNPSENNTIIINQNIIYSKSMKNLGQIFNINSMNDFHQNNYYGNDTKVKEEKVNTEEYSDADHTEEAEAEDVKLSPVCAVTNDQFCERRDDESLSFESYIADKESAHILRLWLHIMMDPISSKNPKEKLIYLRAVLEAKVITHKLPYKVYVREFGNISSNSYYVWMHRTLKYDHEDIDVIIEQYQNFLRQYPK